MIKINFVRLGTSEPTVTDVCLDRLIWGQQSALEEAHAQLVYAVSRGINFINTAELYSIPIRAETCVPTENCWRMTG